MYKKYENCRGDGDAVYQTWNQNSKPRKDGSRPICGTLNGVKWSIIGDSKWPPHLNEKCLKSTYRASTSGVLLHDFSYWQPFWMDTINLDKFTRIYGHENVLNITFEHENTQICPVKIIRNASDKPLLFYIQLPLKLEYLSLSVSRNSSNHLEFLFPQLHKIFVLFKLHGPKSEQVLKDFLILQNNLWTFHLNLKWPILDWEK